MATRHFIDQGVDFTALFCASDDMAMGALSCLQEHDIRIPQEVSVVGYDDTVMSDFTSPRLTAVAIPMCEMAANGCRWLLNVTWRVSVVD